jgi:hypothetical protein
LNHGLQAGLGVPAAKGSFGRHTSESRVVMLILLGRGGQFDLRGLLDRQIAGFSPLRIRPE